MDLESIFENDMPTLESVHANIARLKREIHNKTAIHIRNVIGNVKGLSNFQV